MSKLVCADCGDPEVRVHLGDVPLCDRCADRRIARRTGLPELPEPPGPFGCESPDGRHHELRIRYWRAPTGIVVELEETEAPPGAGYHFSVLGDHDADVASLTAAARERAEREIGRRYLAPAVHRAGWTLAAEEVAGRFMWDDDQPGGRPYAVVVDGRTLTWEEFGETLESFEGCRFRLVIEDRLDDLRSDAEVLPLDDGPDHAD